MLFFSNRQIIFLLIVVIFLSIFVFKPSWEIGGDGYGYYSYLRSLYFDNDLDFSNEMKQFDEMYGAKTLESRATENGKIGNPFAIGWSFFYAPFFILAIILSKIFTFANKFILPGYNFPFQLMIGVGTVFYVVSGVYFLFKALNKLFLRSVAWISALSVLLSSPLIYYVIYEPSMSHGLSFFLTSLLFYKSLEVYQNELVGSDDVINLGLFVGLASLVRWQNLIFIIIPLAILIKRKIDFREFFIYFSVIFVVFSPQLFLWKYLYGKYFIIPQGVEFVNHKLELYNFLFSGYHGLFIWHPLLLLFTIGLFQSFKKYKLLFTVLSISLLIQIVFNANLSDWYGGSSFGSRRMIESLFIFAFGGAYIFYILFQSNFKFKKVLIGIFIIIILIFSGWNYLLMMTVARGEISLVNQISAKEIFTSSIKLLQSKD